MSKASAPEKAPWRIGELAEQTGVSTRSLRHYENQGLIIAQRSSTGQRMFSASAAQQVRHIRMLLDAGLPTRVIADSWIASATLVVWIPVLSQRW